MIHCNNLYVGNLVFLKILDASNNKLKGTIHPSICNLVNIVVLDLSNNTLVGEIPHCLGKTSTTLLILNLKMNRLNGTLPAKFSKCDSLLYLEFSDNQLEGQIPKSLSQCNRLRILDVGNNKFNGTFPSWLNRLPNLQILILSFNSFYGPINSSSNSSKRSFPSLQILDLSNNNFNGKLPGRYNNAFATMRDLNEPFLENPNYMSIKEVGTFSEPNYYLISITLTLKRQQMMYAKVITTMSTFDLSNNNFEGEIHYSIGTLKALRGLNLSHNILSGHIPASIGNLSFLETLDLSSNKLTGHIPQELVKLISLEVFNVSENLLEGSIPHGKQFDTFSIDSYEGNLGLCGQPLPNCEKRNTQSVGTKNDQDASDDDTSIWEIIAMAFGSGLVVGLAWGCCMYIIKKPFWIFNKVNKMEAALIDYCVERRRRRHARSAKRN